jgi:Ca-activated chloride channel family protein
MAPRFYHLESLHWLWLVCGLALLLVYSTTRVRSAMQRFVSAPLLWQVAPRFSITRRVLAGVLVIGAMTALVAALLDPRWGVRYEEVHRRGNDIIFVLDVSRSMLGEDVTPNRLERAKQYINDVVDQLAGDRVALVTFAGVPAVKCPLTVDYAAFRLSLGEATVESAARGGSLLGDALRLAGESFTDETKDFKSVIVFSDGEDQGSYPAEAAHNLLEDHGAKVYTVGIGDSQTGARIPVIQNNQRTYLTYQGQEVWTKMNGDALREMALTGGGAYFPVGTGTVDLGEYYRRVIAPSSSRELDSSRIRVDTPQYQWFAGLALLLLLVESLMSLQRSSPRAAPTTDDQQQVRIARDGEGRR